MSTYVHSIFCWMVLCSVCIVGAAAEPERSMVGEVQRAAASAFLLAEACDELVEALDHRDESSFLHAGQRLVRNYIAMADSLSSAARLVGVAETRINLSSAAVAALERPFATQSDQVYADVLTLRHQSLCRLKTLRDRYATTAECDQTMLLAEIARLSDYVRDFDQLACTMPDGATVAISQTALLSLSDRQARLHQDLDHERQLLEAFRQQTRASLERLPADFDWAYRYLQATRQLPTDELERLRGLRTDLQTLAGELRTAQQDVSVSLLSPSSATVTQEPLCTTQVLEQADKLLQGLSSANAESGSSHLNSKKKP